MDLVPIFSRVNATLEAAMSVGWSVGRSVGPELSGNIALVFISKVLKGTLEYLNVL